MLSFDAIRLTGTPQVHNCEPAWSWMPRPLSDYDLWVVLGGSGRLILDGHAHELAAGRAFALAPGACVRGEHDPRDCLRVFAVHYTMADGPARSLWRTAADVGYLGMLGRHCATAYRSGNRLESTLLVRLILLHIFGCVCRTSAPIDLPIQRLMDEIDESPGHGWSVPELAAAVHLSRQQFNRRFVNVAGVAPMQYVIKTRIDRAKTLLTDTSMTVSQVADALGYGDIYYFSRQFRKEVGVSPREFRSRIDSGAGHDPGEPPQSADGP